jgi:hypothetical protein
LSAKNYERLSDRVLEALNLALAQKDLAISDLLSRALEMAMTRGAGGRDFVERRDFTDEVELALNKLEGLRRAPRG